MVSYEMDEAIKLYEPSDEVLRELGKVTLYAFVGPSGSGKDSIMNRLEEIRPKMFSKVVGDTNRARREGEIDGHTYNFRTTKEMSDDLKEHNFIQVVGGATADIFYGTRPGQFPEDRIAMMAVQAGVMNQFKKFGFKDIKWLQVVPHSDEQWQHWQKNQGHSEEENRKRIEEGIGSYASSLLETNAFFVLNDEVSKAAERVIQISNGRRPDDEQKVRTIAVKNMEALKMRLSRT